MLSVLIPTYNYNTLPLVKEIKRQVEVAKIDFEIIVLDDGAKSNLNIENSNINNLDNCSFLELEKNIGRSAIRNLLAFKAKYDWLLFLDSDVMPTSSNFIYNYLREIEKGEHKVFCGGIRYKRETKNRDFLHYKHGVKNEEINFVDRNKKSFKYFFTSNFLIAKSVFNTIKFEEKLLKYGREDFLFALNLESEGYKIVHISNEIFHLGIVDDQTFINNTKQAMKNLIFLKEKGLLKSQETTLLKFLKIVQMIKLNLFLGNLNSYFERKALQKKSIFYLDCLKLSYLCYLNKKK